jgi:hypothetical protein
VREEIEHMQPRTPRPSSSSLVDGGYRREPDGTITHLLAHDGGLPEGVPMKLPRLRHDDDDERREDERERAEEMRKRRDWYRQQRQLEALPVTGGSSPQALPADFEDYENRGEVGDRHWLKLRAERVAFNANAVGVKGYLGLHRGRRYLVERVDDRWWRPRWAVIVYIWAAPHERGDPPDGRVLYDGPM